MAVTRLTNLEITRRILGRLNKDENLIEHVSDRLGHDFRYSIDSSKICNLGWKMDRTFDDALGRTIDWYLENKDYL